MTDLPAGFTIESRPGSPALPPGFRVEQKATFQDRLQQAGIAPAADDPIVERGALLPLGRTASGQIVPAMPDALRVPFAAMGDLLSGRRTPDQISGEEIFSIGALFAGGSAAAGTGKAIAGAGGAAAPAARAATTATGQAAERLGIDLPRAVASDRPAVQQAGRVVANVPVGGQPVRQAARTAQEQLGEAATRVEEAFGGGNVPRAGVAVEQGVTSFAGRGGVLAERAAAKFERVDRLVDPNVTRPLTETQKQAGEILARRTEAALSGEGNALGMVRDALKRPQGLTYQGLKTLRTRIGEMLDNPSLLPADMSQAELKQVYGALTRDLRATVEAAGGQPAVRAFDFANRSFEKTMQIRESLQKILKTDTPEAAFSRIEAMASTSSRADIQTLAQARAALGADNWNEVASAVIAKMGRDAEGQFSPQRFITAWGKLGGKGKRILFGTTGRDDLAQALDDIVTVSSRFKLTDQYANPSGTGQTVIGTGFLAGAFADPLSSAGTLLGSRIIANVLAKPQTAAPFATWAKAWAAVTSKPGPASTRLFGDASRALALAIAAEEGLDANEVNGDLLSAVRPRT